MCPTMVCLHEQGNTGNLDTKRPPVMRQQTGIDLPKRLLSADDMIPGADWTPDGPERVH